MTILPRHGVRESFGAPAHNTLRLSPPNVYLRLLFEDPDGVLRVFPENFPLQVRFSPPAAGGGSLRNRAVTIRRDGRLTFPAWDNPRDFWRSFTLHFDRPETPVIACESPPSLVSPPLALSSRYLRLGEPFAGHERFFSFPRHMLLRQADWRLSPPNFVGNGEYLSPAAMIRHTQVRADIGSLLSPVCLILNPHWHFLRFEYYDRYYGNAHLDSPPRAALRRRISTLPVRVRGYLNNPDAPLVVPDIYSNWTPGSPPDSANLLQCLPFIMRRNPRGVALSPPDGSRLGLSFRTPENTFVYSVSERERILVSSPPSPPGPDRLRFYDLPRMWKSRNYYTRRVASSPLAPGKFFNTLTADEISQAAGKGSPLVFSLDDMVLVAGDPATASVAAALSPPAARVAVFNHRFDNRIAQSTPQGLYKLLSPPAPDAFDLPRSDVPIVNNYIFDYPDWTRLVLAQGNLFDVFDRRVPDGISPPLPVGARAAVRWIDGTAPLPGLSAFVVSPPGGWVAAPDNRPLPGRMLSPPTQRVDVPAVNPVFSVQPFFQQRPPWPGWRFDGSHLQIGRYDIALLRCADVYEGREIAANFNYFRHHFIYLSPPPPMPQVAVPIAVSDQEYAQLLCRNVANRWSGNDPGVSDQRAQYVPRIPSPPLPVSPPPLRVPAVWFPQSLPSEQAHFTLQMTPGGRDNRNSVRGIGDTGAGSYEEFPVTNPNASLRHWFTAAHETGHMGGLPDEYNERWNSMSYDQASFACLLPGDPYETDGRDDVAPLSNTQASMMNGNKMLRNRYFWHGAEWVRRVINHPLQVSLGLNYPDYWLPEHPRTADGRTFYPWPIAHHVSPPAFPRLGWEGYLFPLGKDHFSQRVLSGGPPRGPFDGIMVIVVKAACILPNWANANVRQTNRADLLNGIQAGVRRRMNNRFWVDGAVHYGAPEPHQFRRCLLQFVADVLAFNNPSNATEQATAQSVLNIYGFDFEVHVDWGGPVTHSWAGNILNIKVNGNPANIDNPFARRFPRMIIGVDKAPAAVNEADLTPVVRRVMPGAIVHRF